MAEGAGLGGVCRHLIGGAACSSALMPDAVNGAQTAVGGRWGGEENYKVISLRYFGRLGGRE